MASSPVEIANSALVRVGAARITSLEDDTPQARVINEHYNKVRKSLLRSHPWNFAKARVELGALDEAPLFDWDYQYELPSDCLRVLGIDVEDANWVVEGRKLLTDENPLNILYVTDVEDTTLFDSCFSEAFAAELAFNIVYAFNRSSTFRKDLADEAKLKLATARSFNAQEQYGAEIKPRSYINSRF